MPRIILKPKSPEFAEDNDRQVNLRVCDMPCCTAVAGHRAPKNRGLDEHYWFCLEHVRDHNQAWDFFYGMSEREVEEHVQQSFYGDRPTWRSDVEGAAEEALRRKAREHYNFTEKEKEPPHEERRADNLFSNRNTPEYEAMAIMGLEPPLSLEKIKAHYKNLVKKHHPDLNQGCEKSEALLKRINMAYTILKLAYKQFEALPSQE